MWDFVHKNLPPRGDGKFIYCQDGAICLLNDPRFFVGGLPKDKSTWTGTVTRFLSVPFDGSAPAYISQATWDAAQTDGMPDDAEYYDLARTFGDQHVPRAG